ncbi:MAG: Bacterial type II secretion system protein G [Firmicutes bacterium ADurb.Bin419]|nr:MAG: Bacterial type II secretion system protein G [Firmicutes bacterium ADurb.Bin419]
MNKKKGFSLTELLVVMAIIAIMVAMFTGAINPLAQINKANDSRRKKDLNRIKIAFEDYYNDNNCYPTQDLIDELTNASNCGDDEMFSPWLRNWPCDPVSKEPYRIVIEESTDDCPDWFKIYANLENRNDNDIPEGWYSEGNDILLSGGYSIDNVNYGTSSTNVSWFEDTFVCSGPCVVSTGLESCDHEDTCLGSNCFIGDCHSSRCHCGDCRFGVCYD